MNPKVDAFISDAKKWQEELILLREIVLDCGLIEEFKWMCPCYTFQKKNILIIHGFKEYIAINLFKGVLLKDEEGILIQQTKNVQEGRQIRFTSAQQIDKMTPVIKAYIYEAIEVEKAGLKVTLKKTEEFNIPEEFQTELDENPDFKTAFEALTPGRQRGYLLHFDSAKQSSTRIARIKNHTPRILSGKGINDCVCGLSKRMPSCDGSHKQLE